MITHSVHNNPRSLRCTADSCDGQPSTVILRCVRIGSGHSPSLRYEKKKFWEQLHFNAPVWLITIIFTVVSRKRVHGRCTLLCAQTGGWADICNIAAFYHEKAPMFTLSQPRPTTGYCTPTHPPNTSLIQFSVYSSQACVASQAAAFFQGKDSQFHAMNLLANRVMYKS